jgi:hypothetical protein
MRRCWTSSKGTPRKVATPGPDFPGLDAPQEAQLIALTAGAGDGDIAGWSQAGTVRSRRAVPVARRSMLISLPKSK